MKRTISLVLALMVVLSVLPWTSANAETGGKLIALTVDDGPAAALLDGLKERGVKATFFVQGSMAQADPQPVRRAYEEGHEIGAHSWDHADLTELSDSAIRAQMNRTFEALDQICGAADYLVRAPYGSANARVCAAVDAPLIGWSAEGWTESMTDAEQVRAGIVAEAFDGAVIHCHDGSGYAVEGVLSAVDDLLGQGYEFVTVSELFRRRGVELQDHAVYIGAEAGAEDPGPIPAPVVNCAADESGTVTVTITCSDETVPIYYTTDGSFPDQDALCYTGPFQAAHSTQVTAVAAYKHNGSRSETVCVTVEDHSALAPAITLNDKGAVVLTAPESGAALYYTVDNTAPGVGSTAYTAPVFLTGGCWIRAAAVYADLGVSAASKAYLSRYGDLYYDMYEGQWFYDAMDWTYRMGILNGTAPYTMNPAGTVTRGMLVTLLYRFSGDSLGADWEKTNGFEDVNQKAYYAQAIEWAYRNKIVDGYSAAAFGPNDNVTRQQMCKIVASFLTWMETPLAPGGSCEDVFADYGQIAGWALQSVEAMVSAGLIQGDGTNMNPNTGANRAQFCVLLTRLVKYIDNYELPDEPDPTDPTDPTEPSEPDHVHDWKLNKAYTGSVTEGGVTIDVGERFNLKIICRESGCYEVPEVEWVAEPDGVVLIEGNTITGLTGGTRTNVTAEWEGVTYKCLIVVRKDTTTEPTDPTEPEPTEPEPTDPEPTEPEHVHDWKLNKALSGSDTDGDVSINVGEWFNLRILCKGEDCDANAEVIWTPSKEGVVSIDGIRITGITAGSRTTLTAEWEGETYSCIVRVRKTTSSIPGIITPF